MSVVRSLTIPPCHSCGLAMSLLSPPLTICCHTMHWALSQPSTPQSEASRRNRFPTHWSRRMPYREKMSPIDHSEN